VVNPDTSAGGSTTDRRRRNDPRRERTRARLVEAATHLVHTEGLSALSVSAVTRRVGVHQSLFYRHFESLDDCLAEAGRQLVAKLSPIDEALRHAVSPRGSFATHHRALCFEQAFESWLDAGPLVELLVVHRLDRSPFGLAMRPLLDAMRDDIAAEIWEGAAMLRVPGREMNEARMLADQLLANYLWALETLIAGRAHGRRALARTLAANTGAMVEATVSRMMGRDTRSVARRRVPADERSEMIAQLIQLGRRLERDNDAALIEHYGGAAALVDLVLGTMARSFLPELCGVRCALRHVIAVPGGEEVRLTHLQLEGARLTPDDPAVEAEVTVRVPLRTQLQLATAQLDPYLAGTTGQLVVEGNAALAAQLPRWFYLATDDVAD